MALFSITATLFISLNQPFSYTFNSFLFGTLQKEDKIRILRQRLAERDVQKSDTQSNTQLHLPQTNVNNTNSTLQQLGNQGKDGNLIVIQADHTTTSDFDSAICGGFSVSNCTRSSRASQSDIEFSESYL